MGKWANGDKVPHILWAMTRKRSREVHFGDRGRGAKIRPLLRSQNRSLSRKVRNQTCTWRIETVKAWRKSLKRRGPRVGVWWKGRRKQPPEPPFSAAFSQVPRQFLLDWNALPCKFTTVKPRYNDSKYNDIRSFTITFVWPPNFVWQITIFIVLRYRKNSGKFPRQIVRSRVPRMTFAPIIIGILGWRSTYGP